MTLTIHDLRLSLREKMKIVDDLEKKLKDLKSELIRKETLIKDSEDMIRKRDEIISNKDAIIKEKDMRILKLEKELFNLANSKKEFNLNSATSSSNNTRPNNYFSQNGANNNGIKFNNNANMSTNPNSNHGTNYYYNANTSSNNLFPLGNIPTNIVTNLTSRDTQPNRDLSTTFSSFNLNNQNANCNPNNFLSQNNYMKAKRIAISAEPAQHFFNKSKDSKITLTEYRKSDA